MALGLFHTQADPRTGLPPRAARHGRRTTIAAAAWYLLCALPAAAQMAPGAWPRCIAERDGQQLGLAGSVCECGHDSGGSMTNKPPGWRWSCDIMRSDGDQLEAPADSSSDRQPLPPDLTYSPTYSSQNNADTQSELPGQPAAGGAAATLPRTPTSLLAGRRRESRTPR